MDKCKECRLLSDDSICLVSYETKCPDDSCNRERDKKFKELSGAYCPICNEREALEHWAQTSGNDSPKTRDHNSMVACAVCFAKVWAGEY